MRTSGTGTRAARTAGAGAAAVRGVGRRLVQAVVTTLAASVVVWALLALAPGDPALRYLQQQHVDNPQPEQIEAVRAQLGLDRPVVVQYGRWLAGVASGDLATSYRSGRPVLAELAARLPATLRLIAAAVLLGLAAAVPTAILAAAFPGRWPDTVARGFALLGAVAPSFVIGLALIEIVVIRWGWGSVITDGSWSGVWLPAVALSVFSAARWSRLLRAGLLESLGSGYALVAAARGAGRLRVLVTHALPNAAIPLITAVGLDMGWLFGGGAIVEAVFSWPGVGRYLIESVAARDLPAIQGFALLATFAWIGISLAADLASTMIDPRIRSQAVGR